MAGCESCGAQGSAYLCPACGVDKAMHHLSLICELTPAARDEARRMTVARQLVPAHGKPGPTLPIDLGAQSRLDTIQAVLTRHMEIILVRRGQVRPWFISSGGDPIIVSCAQLMRPGVLESARYHPGAGAFLADLSGCVNVLAGILATDTAERAERRRAYAASVIGDRPVKASLLAMSTGINVKTIRSWAFRGQLLERDRDAEGNPLYLLGDVMALAGVVAA